MVTNYKYPNNHDFEESMRENGELSEPIVVGMTFNDIYEVVSDNTQQGGMGRAILCRNKIDEKYYVLKTYINKEYKNQFEKEIEFTLKLEKNPYIVYTQTALQEEDKVYMVMELVGKQPTNPTDRWRTKILKDTIQELTIEEKYRYAIEFCKGMRYLNRIGLKAHRDIKPENIFITEDNHIKIADFGLVGLKEDCSGTKGYRSPEQAKGEGTNIQSDIYSFGVVLYEIFNGGKNPYNKTRTNLKEEDFILKEYEKEHPSKNCREIIQKCGEKEEKERYKDFKELEEELLKEAKKELGDDFNVEEMPTKELTAEDYFDKGNGYTNINNNLKALLLYDKSIEKNPNNSAVYSNRSMVKGILGKYIDAINDCDLALKLNPYNTNAYNNMGLAKLKLGQYEESIEDFDRAINLGFNDIKLYFNRGLIKEQLVKYQEAIEDFSKVISLNPKDAQAYQCMGIIKVKLGKNQEAIEDFSKAISLNPNYAQAYCCRGLTKIEEGKNQEAIEDFSKAISLNPNVSQAYFGRGIIKGKLRKSQEAIEDFSEVIKLDSKNTQAYFYRGILEREEGKNQEAIEDFSEVIKLDFNNIFGYLERALTEEIEGEYQKAIEDYNKAIEIKPDFIKGYEILVEIYKKIGKEKEAKEVEEKKNKIIGK